jgi:fatty-acid desaturase
MANQGGPIWWASQHRAHHKYCDGEQDPHSAHQDGVEAAFSFFQVHNTVWEEFAPTHCDSFWLRLVDTWSFVAVTAEMSLAYYLFGPVGLFISFTSAWLCQSGTLWFNVANHPEDIDKPCKAADYRMKPPVNYPAFLLLDLLYPLFATVVGESNHEHHHIHFALAKRGPYDLAYYTFVWPLEKLGVVWNVKYLYTTE